MAFLLKATVEQENLILEVFDEEVSIHKLITTIFEDEDWLKGSSQIYNENKFISESSIKLSKNSMSRQTAWDKLIYYLLKQVFINVHGVISYRRLTITFSKDVNKKDKDFLVKVFRKYLKK